MDEDDENRESAPVQGDHWLDTLGVGAMAALSAGVFVLSIVVMALVSQIGSALKGDAVVANAGGVAFERPEPSITVLAAPCGPSRVVGECAAVQGFPPDARDGRGRDR